MQYKIYEDFYNEVEKKLNRIGKKCKKHGNPFTFNVIGTEIKEVVDEETKVSKYYKFVIVDVEGTAKINDYECVAILENHEHGNVIRRINTEIEIPDRFLHTDNFCEHCNSKRIRKELYIIHNTVTNEFKQVGSNCLMLYTNGLNAEYVASYIDGITELEEFDGIVGGGGKHYIPVDEILSYATEIINKMGYFNSNSNCPTKYLVSNMLTHLRLDEKLDIVNRQLKENNFYIRFNENDFHKENTEEAVKNIIDYYLGINDKNNEFINNVQVLLKEGYTEYQNIGYLCYLPQGYLKHIEHEVERAKQKDLNQKSKYFGNIGERYKDVSIYDMKNIACVDTMYGEMYVYKIVLESGEILIWKTSKWIDTDNVKTITFTVKNHAEYKETMQTEITRCKLS